MSETNVAIIVLAAGASLRMGEPKQLLHYQGESLLRRAVNSALSSTCQPIIAVLGSQAERLQSELDGLEITVTVNTVWEEGLGSSIRTGIQTLENLTTNKSSAAILMLCDQPFITTKVLDRLLEAYQKKPSLIVASAYQTNEGTTLGVPALFSRKLFSELLLLSGTEGAKKIIAKHHQQTTVIEVPEALFDVDTPSDYRYLQAS